MKPDDVSDSIFFIEEGVVEVYTLFEGNIFVLDRLYRGSVMNYRTFFIDDLNYIYAQCKTSALILHINSATISFIQTTHLDFDKKMLSF